MPEEAGVGAARGFEIVGPNKEFADDESASELPALVPKTDEDADRKPAKTTTTEITSTMARIATQREKMENP
jgi:hypothetical protein